MTAADGSDDDFSGDHGDDGGAPLLRLGCEVAAVVMAMVVM